MIQTEIITINGRPLTRTCSNSGHYIQRDGVTYLCNRGTGQPVYNALADMVGIYVEVVE